MKTISDAVLREIFERQTGVVDFDQCYEAGFKSASKQVLESENPFKQGTKEYNFWADGWWDGFYEEKPQTSSQNLSEVHLQGHDSFAAQDARVSSRAPSFTAKESQVSSRAPRTRDPGREIPKNSKPQKPQKSKWLAIAGTAAAIGAVTFIVMDMAA